MNLNNAGLPQPGRELDAWVCEHILGWHADHKGQWYNRHGAMRDLLKVSTTHAFFQVMEAVGGEWCIQEMRVNVGLRIDVQWDNTHDHAWSVVVKAEDYPSREAAYAHAVCCCCWKTRQDDA